MVCVVLIHSFCHYYGLKKKYLKNFCSTEIERGGGSTGPILYIFAELTSKHEINITKHIALVITKVVDKK